VHWSHASKVIKSHHYVLLLEANALIHHFPVVLAELAKSPFGSTKKLCISPIPLHFWDAVYFDLFQSVWRHEKYSVFHIGQNAAF
jgi:hypothetical protein